MRAAVRDDGNGPAEVTARKQKRDRPAWLCYGSDWIAEETYAEATLAERGLLFSVLNYCWVNRSIPADSDRMARLLRIPIDDLKAQGSRLLSRHFQQCMDDRSRLYCPELERQRAATEA